MVPQGYLSLLLHAHLPFVRHPEHAEFLEEKWLFEAVADCYLPLLAMLEQIRADAVPCRLTFSISPTLATMLSDELLRSRCLEFLRRRARESIDSTPAVAAHFRTALNDYERRGGKILEAFVALERDGLIDLITTAATHAFLPLLKNQAVSVRSQIRVGLAEHARHFGEKPDGFWLPECGFFPDVAKKLADAGLSYSIVDTHAFTTAQPKPVASNFSPVSCDGVAFFARDPDSAREVWGPGGFPSASVYRDFHAVDQHGFKPLAVSGSSSAKITYDPAPAAEQARRHAHQFVEARLAQIQFHASRQSDPPIVLAAYDAELFGHWWHEGPQFLNHVIRTAAVHPEELQLATPSDYLARHAPRETATPGASSWGQHGYSDFWINAANNWIHPELKNAATRLSKTLARATSENERAIKQAARSLLIAQASDWPFLMTRGPSASYAEKRLRDQLARVHYLCDAADSDKVDERKLRALELMDNVFPELDCRHFQES